MKKIVSLICLCAISFFVTANERGHFFVDLTSQNIPLISVNSFSSYVDLPDGSSFQLFRDTTDELGIRHQSYQQYFKGNLVQSKMILVHSLDGKVRYIHGAVMDSNSAPKSVSSPISRKSAAAKAPYVVPEGDIETIIFCIEGKYYNVYKVPSPKSLETLYIDVETGDIVYRESAIQSADITMRGLTRYQGWQNMTAYEQNGKYYFLDNGRNMATLAAGLQGPDYEGYFSASYISTLPQNIQDILNNPSSASFEEVSYTYILGPMMNDYITQKSTTIYSEQNEFYLPYLTSITISSATSSWWYDVWDTKPDLYFKIYDDKGNLVHTTTARQDCNLPATFYLSTPILLANEGYVIEIYDEDATTDSYGGSVTLTSLTYGTQTWSGSKTSGSVTIEAMPSEYCDIHWGMQKTLDFYLQKFNRNSYDGNGALVINLAFPPHDDKMFANMPNNATAQSTFQPYYMYYGYGDGQYMNPVVSIDIMSHEFTHMVTSCNGNGGLDYREESGALNESFSDCLAMAVTKYATGTCPWTIGADVMIQTANLRSMSNPKNSSEAQGDTLAGAQPDTYKGQCWSRIPAAIDQTQTLVHRNSGVMNHWFYILSEGKSGKNDYQYSYNVSGIGIDKATAITYRNLIYYLTPCATFADARLGSLMAAADLYGTTSVVYKTVSNAWDAVGVGDKYTEEFTLTPGKYAIVTSRAKETDKNWFYMSATKDGTKDRFLAINTEKTDINAVNLKDLPDDYIWELVADGSNWKLKNGTQYVSWTSNNTATLDATGKSLTFNIADNQVEAYFNDGTADRYLSLNGTTGNNYFAFYGNKNQITHLFFLPVEGTTPTPPTPPTPAVNEYYIVAKRSTGNYYFFTPDKVSGKDRLIAIDAGTSIRSKVDTVNTSSAYLWTLEDSGSGKLLKNHNGSYLTCTAAKSAKMADNGTVLNLTNNSDGTVTFSYAADATTTHYLSLANAGNDYFVFYANTNQVTHLLLLPKGNGAATEVDYTFTTPQCTKFMQDGKVYIKRDGVLYNMMGERIR